MEKIMDIPLRVLVIEDSKTDYEILVRKLRKGGYDPVSVRVQTADDMRAALAEKTWDVIISDFSMPQFDAFEALEIFKQSGLDLPFIVVSGTIGEETAVKAMKAGAHDYFMKNNLQRLCPAIERELREAKTRRGRKQDAEKLIASENRYRRLFESAQDGILILDAKTGKIIDANPFLVELLGFPLEYFIGKKLWELGFIKNKVFNQDNIEELKKEKYIRYEDLPLETRDGRTIEVEFISNCYQADKDEVFQCNIRDVTLHKQAERRERLAREMLELLNRKGSGLDLVRDILLLIKESTNIEAAAIRLQDGEDFPYYETNGFPEGFVQSERFLCSQDKAGNILRDEKGDPVLECMCGNVICQRTDPAFPFFTEGGSFWTNSTTQLLASTSEADRQASTRNRCHGEGYESVALIPLRTDNQTIGLLQFNDSRTDCFTLDMIHFFEGIGASIGIALTRTKAEEEMRAQQELMKQIAENYPNSYLSIINKDLTIGFSAGREFAKQNINPDKFLGLRIKEVFGEHAPVIEENYLKTFEGEETSFELLIDGQHQLYRTVPLYSKESEIDRILSVVENITNRKQMEEQLNQAMKMEAIGRLAGGIAHDFNNALMPILVICDLLLKTFNPGHPVHEDIKEVKNAGERCANLTRQLLAFSSRHPMDIKVINLNDVVINIKKMLSLVIGEDIELAEFLDPDLGNVKADMGQMEQILANLAVNSRDSMPLGGKLTIETRNVDLDQGYSDNHVKITPGPYVMLAVSDTGEGMDEKTREHIFEPFFTTKEKGKGTGLGLASVYGIVKQSGGNIWVYSEPTKGTTFKIYLPLVREKADELIVRERVNVESLRGSETILLVEDEKSVRKVTRRIFEQRGYKVLTAANGDEALKICEEYQEGPIHLLVTDVIMPGMSGKQLADKLSSRYPEIKVIFISGYTDNAIFHHGVLDKNTNFIQKPFTSEALSLKVRKVIDAVK